MALQPLRLNQLKTQLNSLIRAGRWTTNQEEIFFPHKCHSIDMLLDAVKCKLSKENKAIACAWQWSSLGLILYPRINTRAFYSNVSLAGLHPSFPLAAQDWGTGPCIMPHNYWSIIPIKSLFIILRKVRYQKYNLWGQVYVHIDF